MVTKDRLFLGTRKGLVVYKKTEENWTHESTSFLGIPVSLSFVDERTNTWWACLDHGHWGVKLHRSKDEGSTWEEIEAPKFEQGEEVKEGVKATVKYIWAFAHGGLDKPGVLYLGTDPGALFKSEDNGDTWGLVRSLWDHPTRTDGWFGGGRDNPGIHSINVDPRDNDHFYIGISCAGVFETKDGGASWSIANQGLKADYLPDPDAEVGQDPHLVVISPSEPDVMWQQNHCGIFMTEDGAEHWKDVSQKDGPAYFGFAVAVDEKKPKTAWVVPGISDEVRVAVDQALCVCRTDDGGESWKDFSEGLPQEHCFDIVYRHALDVDNGVLAFGTTTGNVFFSNDRGESWETLSTTMPMIYSVHFG